MRPSKYQTAMTIAEAVSGRSHDTETQVGCVLIKKDTGAIVATGYNGFIRQAPDDILANKGPDKYEYMIHAEQNMIFNCASQGIAMKDCILVCTLSPCLVCTRYLWQCGIREVICKELYKDSANICAMKDLDVAINNGPDGFYTITYSEK